MPELPTRMTNFISQMRCYAPPQFNRLWLPNNSNCPLLSSPSHQRGECALPGLEMYVRTCMCEPVSGRESALRPVSSMLGIVLNLCASSVICIVEYQWPPPHAPSPRDARTRSQTAGGSGAVHRADRRCGAVGHSVQVSSYGTN